MFLRANRLLKGSLTAAAGGRSGNKIVLNMAAFADEYVRIARSLKLK